MKGIVNRLTSKLRSNRGFTLLEILLAAFITCIVTASAFEFYASMQGQSEAQQQVTDMQLISRNSVLEIKKNFRQAGFKLSDHDPYRIGGDTVSVFMCGSQPVDTIQYYLDEYTDGEYSVMRDLPDGWRVYRLMRKINSEDAVIFSDYVTFMQVRLIDSSNAIIEVSSMTTMPDYEWTMNNGYRTYSVTERVKMRNI